MSGPKNTLPMMMGEGPFGVIAMGGMFTVLKVRDSIASYEDPGWYDQPAGTSVKRISVEEDTTQKKGALRYTCPMHPEIIKNEPGACPKCGMTLKPVRP